MLPVFVCYNPRHFMVTQNFDVIFTKILHGPPLRPYIWSQLVTMDKSTHFHYQTSPRASKPPILLIYNQLVAHPKQPIYKLKRALEKSTTFYGDPKFRCYLYQKHTWTIVKTLAMNPVGPHGQNIWIQLVAMANTAHLNDQKCFRARKPPIFPIFKFYSPRHFMVKQILTSFMLKTYMDLH
ncbi:hypothetical protein H5410_049324 [Solanum commersonii]|uniref:Uncharacterized protein n=1 Tax=Solanum commersonii TaxID=4109 RepID=A0A9J5WS86_SOLCO|nr:hypothetical protein H5410_049324 [Solanum commersonii]